MKKIFLLITIVSTQVYSQLRINVEDQNVNNSAIIQIDNDMNYQTPAKGFSLPQVKLDDKYKKTPFNSNLKEGMIVFNTNSTQNLKVGAYSWNGVEWIMYSNMHNKDFFTQKVNAKILGYTPFITKPSDVVEGTSVPFITVNNESVFGRLVACSERTVPGTNGQNNLLNTYCIYDISSNANSSSDLSNNFTWIDAFNFAKARGGHLVTITDDSEWEFIKRNVLVNGANNDNTSQKISWLGSVRMAESFNVNGSTTLPVNKKMKFKWITNEETVMNWSDENRINQSQFEAGYPKINLTSDDSNNYAVYISSLQSNTNREWRTATTLGVNESANTDNFKSVSVIVEYTNIN